MDIDPEHERLESMAARIQRAARPKSEMSDNGGAPPLKMSRVGFDFMGTVIASALLGWAIDKILGTQPWFVLTMTILGFAGGIFNVWRALSGTPSDNV